MRRWRLALIVLLAGILHFANGAVAAPPQPDATALQCSFDINFMNTVPNSGVSKVCPHIQPGTNYVVIFSGSSVHADSNVTGGAYILRAGDAQVRVQFAIQASGSAPLTWTAPGSVVQSATVKDKGATATLQFDGNGCQAGASVPINCALLGTLTILVVDP
jgi:hypothetical protein